MADYGTCIAVTDDLPRRWKLATGPRVVAEALVRRWSTERGELPYAPNYGTDARDMIGETQTAAAQAEWAARLSAEAEKDDRVERCEVAVVYDQAAATALISASVSLSGDASFRLVVAVTELTATLLRVS